MASIDKAAIAFSIAIVAVGVGFAAFAGSAQDNAPAVSAPVMTKTTEPKIQADPFADIADKVKSEAPTTTETVEEEVMVEESPELVEEETTKPVEESSEPKTVSVEIPKGTASPGCEESDACFSPASLTINAGDTVEWINVDTAAHTVTSGSPANGPSGAFDSSLIMGGASFENTFDEAGSYDYFCMVHPWMVGNIQVN